MAKKQNKPSSFSDVVVTPLDKIARLLAINVIKDKESHGEKINLLKAIGFQISEIAAILGISENHVMLQLIKNEKNKQNRKP